MTQGFLTFLSRTEVWLGALALAAFLALFWVLRGAPLGQATGAEDEDDDAPGGGLSRPGRRGDRRRPAAGAGRRATWP